MRCVYFKIIPSKLLLYDIPLIQELVLKELCFCEGSRHAWFSCSGISFLVLLLLEEQILSLSLLARSSSPKFLKVFKFNLCSKLQKKIDRKNYYVDTCYLGIYTVVLIIQLYSFLDCCFVYYCYNLVCPFFSAVVLVLKFK